MTNSSIVSVPTVPKRIHTPTLRKMDNQNAYDFYAHDFFQTKCLLRKAKPDELFRYFSNWLALFWSLKLPYQTKR
jgi:hypothetical protein